MNRILTTKFKPLDSFQTSLTFKFNMRSRDLKYAQRIYELCFIKVEFCRCDGVIFRESALESVTGIQFLTRMVFNFQNGIHSFPA